MDFIHFITGWIFGYWFTKVEWVRWTESWKRIKAAPKPKKGKE